MPSADASATVNAASKDACLHFAEKVCDKEKACAPSVLESTYADLAACTHTVAASCEAHLVPPRSATTPESIARCAEARTASCEALLGDPPVACRMTGQGASGSPCAEGAQCAGGFCERDPSRRCGTCRDLPKLQSPCIGAALCDWGLICKNGQCQRRAELGESCKDVACNGALRCSKGQCVAPAEVGQRCDDSDASAPACDGLVGLVCQKSTHTCILPKHAKLGEKCSSETTCLGGAHCAPSAVCERDAREGDPCRPGGSPCVEPAQCLAGVCATLDPTACR
jgi:hypothetical protein